MFGIFILAFPFCILQTTTITLEEKKFNIKRGAIFGYNSLDVDSNYSNFNYITTETSYGCKIDRQPAVHLMIYLLDREPFAISSYMSKNQGIMVLNALSDEIIKRKNQKRLKEE